jgi:hypothetical protein
VTRKYIAEVSYEIWGKIHLYIRRISQFSSFLDVKTCIEKYIHLQKYISRIRDNVDILTSLHEDLAAQLLDPLWPAAFGLRSTVPCDSPPPTPPPPPVHHGLRLSPQERGFVIHAIRTPVDPDFCEEKSRGRRRRAHGLR